MGSQENGMDSFDLELRYSTNEITGRCLKCSGEQELNNCLRQMLREDGIDEDTRRKYEALVKFLKSTDFKRLRTESEKHLAEGKKVLARISLDESQPKYEMIITDTIDQK